VKSDPLTAVDMLLDEMDAHAIAEHIREKRLRATDVLDATLRRIEAANPHINAFTLVTAERARREAQRVDELIERGAAVGPLAGVPFAVKNLFDIAGVTTLAGSAIRRSHPAASSDATVVRRLCDAGAVLVGALNMDEFAYGFTTENTHYGPTRNPHDVTRTAGGSSGGSGAAVAAALVPFALGTDTGGSIRVPASLCGIFGLRPTYGRLSRTGTVLFAPSLDHVGPLCRSARDLALVYDLMQGPDPADPACSAAQAEPTHDRLALGIDGLRFGVAGGYFRKYATPDACDAVDRVARHYGAGIEVTFPQPELSRSAAYVISASEGAALHLEDLQHRLDQFDPNTRGRFLAGAFLPASWSVKAQRFRRWFNSEVDKIFAQVDIVLAPATPCSATPLGLQTIELGGETMIARPALGLLTQPFSATGLSIVTVPVRRDDGLPLGVQVMAPAHKEELALRVAYDLERSGIAKSRIKSWS
jgi:AtzE family amidohydrolase